MGIRAQIAVLVVVVVVLGAGAALADVIIGGDASATSTTTVAAGGYPAPADPAPSTSPEPHRPAAATSTSETTAPPATTTVATERSTTTSGLAPTIPPQPIATSTTAPPARSPQAEPSGVVVAWQPSHQDDTGSNGWHEYEVCGDIVRRAIDSAPSVSHVLAWETGMGLTGSNNNGGTNRPAFDSELGRANEAGADYFISVHNDGGAPSGVLGMYFAGDHESAAYAERFARALAAETGLPYRGTRGHDLYSLDPVRNDAPIRILLEIGDNQADRAFLEDAANRQKIADVLAEVATGLKRTG